MEDVIGRYAIGFPCHRRRRHRIEYCSRTSTHIPDASVHLLEKEADCGLHASGRNSGVLHAGFYYSPDSLKARFTWRGNRLLTEYCEEKKIPLNKCGKLVVAKGHADHAGLDERLKRAANGIPLEELSEKDAKVIEPRVKTCERALFSPATLPSIRRR